MKASKPKRSSDHRPNWRFFLLLTSAEAEFSQSVPTFDRDQDDTEDGDKKTLKRQSVDQRIILHY